MSRPAISVENLSKVYRLGVKDQTPDTIAGAFTGALRSPLKNWRRLRDLARFRPDDDSPDALWALRDVSFEVAEGEVLGVIGRNGAGKSTLLKILSRITEPTHGRAVIHGRVSSLLEVGTGFHPELTGRENIYMNGTILGMRKREIDRKFDEIVDFSGVEKFLDTPIKRYSSGMNVRLAFAVAAHLEPEILIIDEVLAVGDAEFQKKCLGKMHDVAQDGRTVLFVSHNMAAVESLCNRGMYLAKGRLADVGPIVEIVSLYRSHIMAGVESARQDFHHTQFFRKVEIFDEAGSPSNLLPIGRDLRLRLILDPDRPVKYPRVVVGINDILGYRLMSIQTPANGKSIGAIDGPTTLECVVHDFPLAPGAYVLSLALWENRELIESVPESGAISVVDAPLFDEGRGFLLGVCVARSTWTRN